MTFDRKGAESMIFEVNKLAVCGYYSPQEVADRLQSALDEIYRLTAQTPVWDKRGAERLADEVAALIWRRMINSDSPAADALLDYREPPSSSRSDRLALFDEVTAERDRLSAELHAATTQEHPCKKGLDAAEAEIDRLARERDRMLAVKAREWEWQLGARGPGVDQKYVQGWNDALEAVAQARSGS